MIYFLAALQAVDRELYEAAEVDGAARVVQFWHVTLPGIRPVLIFMILVGTIGAFQLFELPCVLFQQDAGPDNRGLTIVMYLFQTGFQATTWATRRRSAGCWCDRSRGVALSATALSGAQRRRSVNRDGGASRLAPPIRRWACSALDRSPCWRAAASCRSSGSSAADGEARQRSCSTITFLPWPICRG